MDISPRAVVAVVMFIFGTTFLWLTPALVGTGAKAEGAIWTFVQILSLLTVLGFAAAAYGVWRDALPWEPIAIVSGVVGVVAVGAYAFAVRDLPTAANVPSNLVIHAGGSAAVLLFLLLPATHSWLLGRL